MTMRELRLSAGFLQVDVAKKMNVSQAAVSRWESGETQPCKKHCKKLAKLYRCSQEDLSASMEETRRV